jgi:hypothetical protein
LFDPALIKRRYNYARLAQAPSGGTLLAIEISGGVVERFMAPVLKTGKAQAFVGSNPTPSAIPATLSNP